MKWNKKSNSTSFYEEYSEEKIKKIQQELHDELNKNRIKQAEQSISGLKKREDSLLVSIQRDLALLKNKKKRTWLTLCLSIGPIVVHLIVYFLIMNVLIPFVHFSHDDFGVVRLWKAIIWLVVYGGTFLIMGSIFEDTIGFSYFTEESIRSRLEISTIEIERIQSDRLKLLDKLKKLKQEG